MGNCYNHYDNPEFHAESDKLFDKRRHLQPFPLNYVPPTILIKSFLPISKSKQSINRPNIIKHGEYFEFVNKDNKHLRRSSELLRVLLAMEFSLFDIVGRISGTIPNTQTNNVSMTSIINTITVYPLFRDQSLRTTKQNKKIMRTYTTRVFTRKGIAIMRANIDKLPPDTALIIVPPFCNLDMIVPGIYQTGITGIVMENLLDARVKVIINATYEMPLLKNSQIVSVRVPVEDDSSENISEYFDNVADLMEATRLRGFSSVVHCMAGVSRSAALILAYMIKYTTFTFLDAFLHVKSIRSPMRPNIGFIQQLSTYEQTIRGKRSVEFEDLIIEDRYKVCIPKFYRKYYPDLFDLEVNRQVSLAKSGKDKK